MLFSFNIITSIAMVREGRLLCHCLRQLVRHIKLASVPAHYAALSSNLSHPTRNIVGNISEEFNSLPLNRSRRFGRHVIRHPRYISDFIDDAVAYGFQ